MTNEERKQFIETVLKSQSAQEQRLQEWTKEKYFAALESVTIEQFGREYWALRATFAQFAGSIARAIEGDEDRDRKKLFGETRWRRIARALDIDAISHRERLENAIKSGNVYPLIEEYVTAMLEAQSFLRDKALMVAEKANAGMKRVSLRELEKLALESGLTKQQWQTALQEARKSRNYAELLKLNPFDGYALSGIVTTLQMRLQDLLKYDIDVLSSVSEKVASKSLILLQDYSLWFKDETVLSSANENADAATPSSKSEYMPRNLRISEEYRQVRVKANELSKKGSSGKLKSAEEILAPYRRLLSEMQPYMEKIWFLLLNDGKPYRDEKREHLDLTCFGENDRDDYPYLIAAVATYEACVEIVEALASLVPLYLKPVVRRHRSFQLGKIVPPLISILLILLFAFLIALLSQCKK